SPADRGLSLHYALPIFSCRHALIAERRSWLKLSSFESSGDLSNHLGTSSSAAIPSPSRPSKRRTRARANNCGASRSVTIPKRNRSEEHTSELQSLRQLV